MISKDEDYAPMGEEAVEFAHDVAMNDAEGPMDSEAGCAQSTGPSTDVAWQRQCNRRDALSYAVATCGKKAKASEVIDAATKYIAFIEG